MTTSRHQDKTPVSRRQQIVRASVLASMMLIAVVVFVLITFDSAPVTG